MTDDTTQTLTTAEPANADDDELREKALSVGASRKLRDELVARFGVMPLSILRLTRGSLSRKTFHFSKELAKSTGRGKRAENKGGVFYTDRALRISGGGSRTTDGRALSVMAPELVEFFVKYYAKPGDVYLDPFAGQGVRMQVAASMGLHYIATDLSKEFVEYMHSVQSKINVYATYPETADLLDLRRDASDFMAGMIERRADESRPLSCVVLNDARDPYFVPDECGDFGFTSPPYWDIEYYGDDPGQLGTGKSYDEFLTGLLHVARAWLAKFKRGATFVVNINDFRKDGAFYMYHADLAREFTEAGWRLDDIWIVEGLIGGLPKVFAASSNMRRIAPKVHEYCLVFRKP